MGVITWRTSAVHDVTQSGEGAATAATNQNQRVSGVCVLFVADSYA